MTAAPEARAESPAERLGRVGSRALSDEELFCLALGRKSSGVTARDLPAALRGAPALEAVFELARRHWDGEHRPVLDGPERVMEHVPREVRQARREHLLAFSLNARNQLLHLETVSIGTLSASLVHPREVFAPAIAHAAAAVVVAHNHPSGDPAPSAEDREATHRLRRAGEILGIPLLDHVIVAARGYFSFQRDGGLS